MTKPSPLHDIQSRCGAEFMRYGPDVGSQDAGHQAHDRGMVEVVESFGAYEAEYAAIRRRVGILHLPQRGLVQLGGSDRVEFLNRLISNDVAGLCPGECRRAFLLNEKGRIEADLIVLQDETSTLLDLDVFDAARLMGTFDAKLFAEDVSVCDISDSFGQLVLHGPSAFQLLNRLAGQTEPGFESMTHRPMGLAGQSCRVCRRDDTGALGLHLFVPVPGMPAVYQALLDASGFEPGAEIDAEFGARRRDSLRGRPVGWLAYNTARIEAGTPIFHIDFGTDSLPAETGVLDETVCFTKGCYLGQEIVARMKSLGHPRRVLVGLKVHGKELPVAGAQVFESVGGGQEHHRDGSPIGGVTSSTISPILGHGPIAFAVMKWGPHVVGTEVAVSAEGRLTTAEVQSLQFLGKPVGADHDQDQGVAG